MALAYAERVKETTRTTGTGTLNLEGAPTGFQTFVAGIGTTNECTYVIVDPTGSSWEVGHGTVTDASPDTLSRSVLASSNAGALVNFAAGSKTVINAPTANKFEEAVNVRDFGATGDGTTDDSAAIQAAIDAIPTTGGNVYLPSGTYRVDTGLTITTDDVSFVGDGYNQTTITTAVSALTMLTLGDGVSVRGRINVEGIAFLQTGGSPTGSGVDIRFNNTTWVRHVLINGFREDIHIRDGCFNIYITDFRIENCSFGVFIDNGASVALDLYIWAGVFNTGATTGTGLHIKRAGGVYGWNFSTLTGSVGVAIVPETGDECSWFFFDSVLVDTPNQECWIVAPTGSGIVKGVNCVNCWASSSRTRQGVSIGGQSTTQIDGFRWDVGRVIANFLDGILISGGGSIFKNVRISNSDVGRNSITGSAVNHGIAVAANTNSFQLMNNFCGDYGETPVTQLNIQGWGIIINAGTSDDYMIVGNDCTGNVTGGVIDAGTGTTKIVKDNLIGASNIPENASATTLVGTGINGARATSVTGPNDIETITLGYEGQVLTIIWAAGATFGVIETGNIALDAALASGAATDTLTLIYDGATWLETSRSTNA